MDYFGILNLAGYFCSLWTFSCARVFHLWLLIVRPMFACARDCIPFWLLNVKLKTSARDCIYYDCSLSGLCLLVLVIASPFGCSMWSSRHLPVIASTLLVVGHTTGLYYLFWHSELGGYSLWVLPTWLLIFHCGPWVCACGCILLLTVGHSNFMGSTGEMLLFVSCVVNLFTLFLFSIFLIDSSFYIMMFLRDKFDILVWCFLFNVCRLSTIWLFI